MRIENPDFSNALINIGPAPEHPKRMRRFGQLIGAWDARGRRLDEESGEWTTRDFTWLVQHVLGGRGIQDLEVVEGEDPQNPMTVAAAMRIYDPVAGLVRVSYFSPASDQYCNLVAQGWRDGIRQDGTQNDGRPIRWNFSAITDDSYTWDGWVSNDDGSTWALVEHIEGTRIS